MAVIWGTPAPLTTRVVQMEPGSDADLDAIHAKIDQIARAFVGRRHCRQSIARPGIAFLQMLHGVHHALAVAVRGIDHQHIHFLANQSFRAFQVIAGRAERRAALADGPDRLSRRSDTSTSSEYP